MDSIIDFRRLPAPKLKAAFHAAQKALAEFQGQIWEASEWQRKMILDALAPIQELIKHAGAEINNGLPVCSDSIHSNHDRRIVWNHIYTASCYPDKSLCEFIADSYKYRGPNLVRVCCPVEENPAKKVAFMHKALPVTHTYPARLLCTKTNPRLKNVASFLQKRQRKP